MQSYKTLLKAAESEITEKRSRFIAYVSPVSSEQEAAGFIEGIKKKNFSAKHNVFAYRLKSGAERYSEDGEPQGTAGAPVLELLKSMNLTDCAVVVTRYFGGILLGTGGLVRAYTCAAKQSIELAGEKIYSRFSLYSTVCGYSLYGRVESAAAETGGRVKNADFSQEVRAVLLIPGEKEEAFEKRLRDSTNGAVTAKKTGEIFA